MNRQTTDRQNETNIQGDTQRGRQAEAAGIQVIRYRQKGKGRQ